MKKRHICKKFIVLTMLLFAFGSCSLSSRRSFAQGVSIRDSSGHVIYFEHTPCRIVSLVPGITEMIVELGEARRLAGITYHTLLPERSDEVVIVGGFFAPNPSRIRSVEPDLVIYARSQKKMLESMDWKDNAPAFLHLEPKSIKDAFQAITEIGKLLGRSNEAEAMVKEQQADLELISKKLAFISPGKRKRVMRIMGRSELMTPSASSFQQEVIRAAGGIPPGFGENGEIVSVSLDEWKSFNPQVIYGCGGDRRLLEMLESDGWKDVDAIKNRRVYFFPCDLTCRASTHIGYFVKWLAATIYPQEFMDPDHFVSAQGIISRRPVGIDLDYVKGAWIARNRIKDFVNKSLVVRFENPQDVTSTLEGERSGIEIVGNHYMPPPLWGIFHKAGLAGLKKDVFSSLALDPKRSSFLYTGADMDNLAVSRKSFKAITVYALVTAGVMSNAQRQSMDKGVYYPSDLDPGTINIIILTNCHLTKEARARAIITATEAKTAALQDLDIRSSYQPQRFAATGTGTDNVLVVSGKGPRIDSTGGHSKAGELMAKAVYDAVKEAIKRQNRIWEGRSIFQRLKERRIRLFDLVAGCMPERDKYTIFCSLQSLLLDPENQAFLRGVMAISDEDAASGGSPELLGEAKRLSRDWLFRRCGKTEVENDFSCLELSGMPRCLEAAFKALLTAAQCSGRSANPAANVGKP